LKRSPEQVEVKGEVLGKSERKLTRVGSSEYVNVPAEWLKKLKFLNRPVIQVELVRDEDGEHVLIISRVKKTVKEQLEG